MKIEKDAENILNKFSKTLENIPDLEETWYITDNLNLTREDKSHEKHPEKRRYDRCIFHVHQYSKYAQLYFSNRNTEENYIPKKHSFYNK